MVRFLRILSGIIVQYQVFFQHGAGGRLQQGKKLRAEYDFTDAYNGGNSLKFSGDVAGKTDQDVRLYSTKLEVTEKTKTSCCPQGRKRF
ncbi:endo-beta-N-acetylglucosaminidase [Streptococcus pneumoniae]|nr:endo-beta-N-acetylglucosaminidase [Streptococcus pneumoniae]